MALNTEKTTTPPAVSLRNSDMQTRETVFIRGRRLGHLTWDGNSNVAAFTPYVAKLKTLEDQTWHCPVEARNAIQKEAERLRVYA